MQAYIVLYPYAVICMAIAASCSTIIGGLFSFITLVRASQEWAVAAAVKRAQDNGNRGPDKVSALDILPYVLGGTAIFVASCLAAMIELKIGAWVASIGCS